MGTRDGAVSPCAGGITGRGSNEQSPTSFYIDVGLCSFAFCLWHSLLAALRRVAGILYPWHDSGVPGVRY